MAGQNEEVIINDEIVEVDPNEGPEQSTEVETPDENESEQPVEETQDTSETQELSEEPDRQSEERKPSRRESLRIKKLLEDNKRLRQQVELPPSTGLNYGQALDADAETIQQLEQDRQQYGRQAYSEGLRQAESIQFRTRLELDTPKIENKYPQLNPNDKEHFDPVIADALNTHYLTLVGYDGQTDSVQNANLRYADFIEAQYELADALATKKVAQAQRNIARQVATTGLRPDGSAAKRLNLSQDPSRMTDEELAAYGRQLGLSSKKR